MYNLTPVTPENTPFRSSCDVLARYADDGVSHARLIAAIPGDENGDEYFTDVTYYRGTSRNRS